MARTNIPVTQITVAGATPAAQVADSTNDQKFDGNDGRIFLEVQNVSTSEALTVTVQTPRTVAGGVNVAEVEVSVPKESTRVIGPFPPQTFNQDTGQVFVDTTSTSLKLRAFRL
jgi:hypothetical protein